MLERKAFPNPCRTGQQNNSVKILTEDGIAQHIQIFQEHIMQHLCDCSSCVLFHASLTGMGVCVLFYLNFFRKTLHL